LSSHPVPTDSTLAQSPTAAPFLRTVNVAYAPLAEEDERPTLSLGGATERKLKTFTIGSGMRGRSMVDDTDFTPDELTELLETAARLKGMHRRGEAHRTWPASRLAMIFQHPSTRTRVSFEAGCRSSAATPSTSACRTSSCRRGETVSDTARVLSRYCDAILARVKSHDDVVELAQFGTVPVINGLSDKFHPTQPWPTC
jgi:ornithine carbamoyltransferase